MAIAKGGISDLSVLEAIGAGGHLRTPMQRRLAALVRGGAIMAVPMVAWPETFYTFATYMVSIFRPGRLAALAIDIETSRLVLASGYAVLFGGHALWGLLRQEDRFGYAVEITETLLLIAYFLAVPVVLAVGLYFPLWYSARQVGRTMLVEDDPNDYSDGGLLSVLNDADPGTIALGAWGILMAGAIGTFAIAGSIFLLAPAPLGGASLLPGLVAFWAIFISVIALPHVVIGWFWDRSRGIWYVP